MKTPIVIVAPRRYPHPVQQPVGGGRVKKRAHNYVAQAAKKHAGTVLGNADAARDLSGGVDKPARPAALVQRISSKRAAHAH